MDIDNNLSCDDFLLPNTSSSLQTGIDYPCTKEARETKPPSVKKAPGKCEPPPEQYKISSSSSSMSSGLMSQDYRTTKEHPMKTPNIAYELAVAKSIMQQYSSISGDNLFDHLSDVIKRVIDERPPNVIDFFEEFSRNVREQKFHLPERFPPHAVFEENRMYKVAKKQLISMKLPYPDDSMIQVAAEDDLEEEHAKTEDIKLELKQEPLGKFHTFNECVQHLQFFWNQCGFSISNENIFQLACSMNRLQTHPSIMQCRFWGVINGLKASYYIVEASLTNEEYESRLLQMEKEIQENHQQDHKESLNNPKQFSHIGPELTPGALGWENHPEEDLFKMKAYDVPIPLVEAVDVYDIPPEHIGKGVNRYSYFVVNSLSDEWIELPIVTPKQIVLSRQIKKFLTGDLEADIVSYPYFCGKEKHYLRALIARITAGTYIAPKNYYRKMTKKEIRLFEGIDEDEAEDEEEEEEEESQMGEEEENEDGVGDNDIVLLKNEKYDTAIPLNTLNNSEKWVHVRPNILQQGRIVWYNEVRAQREREKERKRLEKLRLQEEMGEDESEHEEDDEEADDEGEEEELEEKAEKGPAILTSCSQDVSSEIPIAWTGRFTSKFTNQNERILIMKSNIWPGACTFIYKDLCESIYLGWGHKYVSRNMSWKHMTAIADEYQHKIGDFIETIDPSVEMEEAYQLSLLKKELKFKQIDDYEEHEVIESTDDDKDDEDDDDEDEEEE
ncbi:radial spoke head protein 4 homolog A [Lucilia cuprina]|uniref:radial spoke head protein 4 homolog A n=1 Tax=Lucilia cuprina TaxID=7375 RepID=UPI001F06B038|nr:radial spoke head protein 4 homolog A [Lucilia cuprina]